MSQPNNIYFLFFSFLLMSIYFYFYLFIDMYAEIVFQFENVFYQYPVYHSYTIQKKQPQQNGIKCSKG